MRIAAAAAGMVAAAAGNRTADGTPALAALAAPQGSRSAPVQPSQAGDRRQAMTGRSPTDPAAAGPGLRPRSASPATGGRRVPQGAPQGGDAPWAAARDPATATAPHPPPRPSRTRRRWRRGPSRTRRRLASQSQPHATCKPPVPCTWAREREPGRAGRAEDPPHGPAAARAGRHAPAARR